jgi:hypothetical protein
MQHGVSDDVQAPRGSFLCAPHLGGMRFHEEAAQRLRTGVQEGWAAEYDSLPYWPLRCDPYSTVDESARAGKPKFRLTNDHSWPPPGMVSADGSLFDGEGHYVPSLNEAMDRGAWPQAKLLKIQQVAEAAAVLQASGAPVKAGVLDVVAYYKQFGRQLAELHRNGVCTADGFIIDERCCFGSAADAVKCCRASNFFVFHARKAMQEVDALYPTRHPLILAWLAHRRKAADAAGASEEERSELWEALHAVGMYIDDGSHVSFDDALYDVDGAPLMRGGVHVRRADEHFCSLPADNGALRAGNVKGAVATILRGPPWR